MDFPRDRYERAGATGEEIDALQLRFDLLPAAGQLSYLDNLKGTSDYDIAQQLVAGRQPAAEPEPEPVEETKTDSTATATATVKGKAEQPGE